jgi:hypothetical protein
MIGQNFTSRQAKKAPQHNQIINIIDIDNISSSFQVCCYLFIFIRVVWIINETSRICGKIAKSILAKRYNKI